ncbi:MAG: NADH-ubiquinone oxidoreductase-F iron-sulfur binding region domain-containing protein, partial [Tepidiformaceae bacterium]
APLIFQHGAEWWSGISDAKEKGTKMFTISGQINQPCCVEIPFGPTVKTLLEQYGGGMKPGSTLKGFQPGGPLSGMLAGSDVNLTLTLDPYRERGMFLGSGGVIFFDQHTSVIDLCTYFLGFCEDESCGRCTTCHGGTQRAVEILRRMSLGGGRESDLDSLDDIVKTLVWSNCLHGQFSATSVKTALKVFRSEFETIIREKRDPTRTLPGLIQYVVKSQSDPGLAEAAELCPTGSLVAEGSGYVIDPDDACIRCGICAELAPSAIEIRDRFPVYVVDAAASAAR